MLDKEFTCLFCHHESCITVQMCVAVLACVSCVLVLLAALAFAIFRLARNSKDPFVRLATVGVGVWLTAQGLWNVGSVLGLLPITGVALPLVSYGGSSLVPTLVAIGMLLSFARQEPAARSALRRKQTARSLRRR